jgi:hypothetical protein
MTFELSLAQLIIYIGLGFFYGVLLTACCLEGGAR